MNDTRGFASFIDNLTATNAPFALWSVPGSNTPRLLISGKEMTIVANHINDLEGEEGFLFAPYRVNSSTPVVLLKPRIMAEGISEILQITLPAAVSPGKHPFSHAEPFIIDKKQYLKEIDTSIETMKSSKLSKVIISRLNPCQRNGESIGEIYCQLLKQTPNAFVYLVNLMGIETGSTSPGLWMGATPEVLLRSEGKTLETVSLAGTQSRRDGNDYSWHTKEIEEQAFVSRYLLDLFYKFGIHPYTTRGPETLESGKVAHLATSFRFSAKNLHSRLGDFITELHPTPAVCGYPKPKADRFIEKMEKHDRRYYTGFLGTWHLSGAVELYVNLRCMEILPEQYLLYSGSGITARSIPEAEWDETNKKATTLLSAIETVQSR